MPEIIVLSCPVCGASIKHDAERCEYCGSYIVIKTNLPKLSRASLNQAVIQDHIQEFRRRSRANLYDEEARYGLGVAYYTLGLLEDAVRELTDAATLMPENSSIQVQLAIVFRDLYQAGDDAAFKSMVQRVNTTLKLDPNNIDALALLYVIQLADGDVEKATRTIARLRSLSSERANAADEDLLTHKIESRLGQGDWDEMKRLILQLDRINPHRAREFARQEFYELDIDLPVRLVNPIVARLREKSWRYSMVAAFIVAVILANLLEENNDPAVSALVLVGPFLVIVSLARLSTKRLIEERAITIHESQVSSNSTTTSEVLLAIDHALLLEDGTLVEVLSD